MCVCKCGSVCAVTLPVHVQVHAVSLSLSLSFSLSLSLSSSVRSSVPLSRERPPCREVGVQALEMNLFIEFDAERQGATACKLEEAHQPAHDAEGTRDLSTYAYVTIT